MEKPNVLLIVLDTVRAHDVSALNEASDDTTPFLSSFTERDSVTQYTNARSPALWTLPSHTSMFTGEPVYTHQITALGDTVTRDTIFHELSDSGYKTGVFTENPFLASETYGLNDAFNHTSPYLNVLFPEALTPQSYDMEEGARPYFKYVMDSVKSGKPVRSILNGVYPVALTSTTVGQQTLHQRNDAKKHADRFLSWTDTDRPWAACLNFVDAHAPYTPTSEHNNYAPDSYRSQNAYSDPSQDATENELKKANQLYKGGILQCDATVEHIIQTLEDRGFLDNTLIVITSDHGEAFGEPIEHRQEDRVVAHRGGLNEEQLHVPLVVHDPNNDGGRVDSLASPIGFADAVSAFQNGKNTRDSFVREELLVSHEYEGSVSTSGAGEWIHALYRSSDSTKHVKDRGETHQFVVSPLERIEQSDVESQVDTVLKNTESETTVSENEDIPVERLRDLGYLDE